MLPQYNTEDAFKHELLFCKWRQTMESVAIQTAYSKQTERKTTTLHSSSLLLAEKGRDILSYVTK